MLLFHGSGRGGRWKKHTYSRQARHIQVETSVADVLSGSHLGETREARVGNDPAAPSQALHDWHGGESACNCGNSRAAGRPATSGDNSRTVNFFWLLRLFRVLKFLRHLLGIVVGSVAGGSSWGQLRELLEEVGP